VQLVITDTTSSRLFWNPYLHYGWIPAKHLEPGMHLKTPDGQSAVVVGGSVPAVHDGWMWDLTVPGNNDHDFYVAAGDTAVLVHNTNCDPLYEGSGWQHVLNEHVPGSPGVAPGNTLFNGDPDLIGDQIEEAIDDGDSSPNTGRDPVTGRQRNGTVYTYDFGYTIGTTQGDDPVNLSKIQVVLNPDGSIRTAFPIK
jgi:hypothetical protein